MQRQTVKSRLVLILILTLTLCIPHGDAETAFSSFSGENDSSSKVPPITYPKSARLCRDLQQQQRIWAERMMLAPFKAQLPADQPWSKDALAFVEEAVAEWAADPAMENAVAADGGRLTREGRPVLLADRGFQLFVSGCRDPLVLFLTNHFRRKTQGNAGLANSAFQAFTELDASKDYPRALAWLAGLYADLVLVDSRNESKRLAEVDKCLPELASETFQAGDYAGVDDRLFLFHALYFRRYIEREFEAFSAVCQTPSLPEWVRRTILGSIEGQRAWKDRGGGWASEVKEEGWKGFGQHLQIARDELTKAWKLRPDSPWAPAEMIAVTMCGHGNRGDTERLWFDRAIAAQFDFGPAYDKLLWAYRPRWGGSHEKMLAFGRACAATNRYDTRIPRVFISAVDDISEELGDWRKLYHDPEIAAQIVALDKAVVNDPHRAFERERRTGYLAVDAYLCRDIPTATEAFQKLDNYLTGELEKRLKDHGFELPLVLKDLEALNSPQGKSYQAAEKLLEEKKNDQAIAAYEMLLKEASGTVAEIARTRLDMLKTEKALESGDWVQLPEMKWDTRGGEWICTPEGYLEPKETPGKTIAIAPLRVGGAFEFRADLDITVTQYPVWIDFSAVIGFRNHGADFGNCAFCFKAGSPKVTAYSCYNYFKDLKRSAQVPLENTNRYWVQVWNGRVTFYLNGVKVCQDYESEWLKGDLSQCRMGFAAGDIPRGTLIIVRNIELRLLKSKPPLPVQSASH